jgi:trehalose 2-sulfotransferase
MKPTLSYLICCVPRTGSWLLSETLQSIGIAGRPREYFDPATRHRYLRLWGMPADASFTDFFDRVKTEATTPNGVFGAKIHWYQFEDLQKHLALARGPVIPERGLLQTVLPDLRYVFLTRRDKVRHAISYARASETKLWWEIDPFMGPTRCVLAKTPRFDVARFDRLRHKILDHERRWRQYFRQHGISPLTVEYEDVARDHAGETRRVLDYLQIPVPTDLAIGKPRLRKQSDGLSETWARQYRMFIQRRQAADARRTAASGVST